MEVSALWIDPERLKPYFSVIKKDPPSASDIESSAKLQAYMSQHFPTETEHNIKRRSIILSSLRKLFRDWIKDVCMTKGLPEDVAAEAGGQIYVSGSYRLGVNEPGADIDTICVAPKYVERKDFFSSFKEILLNQSQITNLVAIEEAIVPLITFDFDEINIDLQIAILPLNSIADNINILDDKILDGVDMATEKSLNGPRVTEIMIKLTPNRDSFITVLRVVRRWAKRRGLYSNKLGFLGGINWCILVCFVNQLYPNASPSALLFRFFMVLAQWKWPSPIQLCERFKHDGGLEVWEPNYGANRHHAMPILTPAYPSMNSSVSVSSQSLLIMNEEFKRAHEIVGDIIDRGSEDWGKLFEGTDFFAVYQHYLAVEVTAPNQEDFQAWSGYCESRLRKLVDSLTYISPLRRIRAFPQKFPISTDEPFGVAFYVAFDIDKNQVHSKELRIDSSVEYFKFNDLYRWTKRKEGMDVMITHILWKNLPECVFQSLGGRLAARNIRKVYMKKKKASEVKPETTVPPLETVLQPEDDENTSTEKLLVEQDDVVKSNNSANSITQGSDPNVQPAITSTASKSTTATTNSSSTTSTISTTTTTTTTTKVDGSIKRPLEEATTKATVPDQQPTRDISSTREVTEISATPIQEPLTRPVKKMKITFRRK